MDEEDEPGRLICCAKTEFEFEFEFGFEVEVDPCWTEWGPSGDELWLMCYRGFDRYAISGVVC